MLMVVCKYFSVVPSVTISEFAGLTPLRSANYGALVGMSCIVSSAATGYNYDVWANSSLLSQYKYTIDAKQVIVLPYIPFVEIITQLQIRRVKHNYASKILKIALEK